MLRRLGVHRRRRRRRVCLSKADTYVSRNVNGGCFEFLEEKECLGKQKKALSVDILV
jgi:hypothetical protein